MNDIINILGLEDDSVQITNIAICDMKINHPVLQDGFQQD